MSSPEFEPLLDDLVADSGYREFRTALKQRALGQLRRRRLWRQVSVGVAAVISVVAFALWPVKTEKPLASARAHASLRPQPQQGASASGLQAQAPTPGAPNSSSSTSTARIETLSDSEMLALFPADSVFLAEINGRSVLIFRDEKLRDLVMR
jgi:hypothetical protein